MAFLSLRFLPEDKKGVLEMDEETKRFFSWKCHKIVMINLGIFPTQLSSQVWLYFQ